MAIDVVVSERVRAPRAAVSNFVMDHRNDTAWIGGISESELLGDAPLTVGSDVRRVASFMGRRIVYVNRVTEIVPGRRLAMRSIEAPFPMQVTYAFDGDDGRVEVSVRVQGEPAIVYKVAGPLLARQVRRSVAGDLRTLKRLMEAPGS